MNLLQLSDQHILHREKLEKGQRLNLYGPIVIQVQSGLLESYWLDDDGSEIPLGFHMEMSCPQWVGIKSQRWSQYLVGIEEASFYWVSVKDLLHLGTKDDFAFDLYESILEENFSWQLCRERIYRSRSEKKITQYIAYFKTLVDRIPQQALASFLNVTPQSLCRIKRKIKNLNMENI
jgi:hypothetical protein